ncbi:MAG: RES family NAD+ phosphorylase [Armatimonadetes bacterium]|nr:RES family NAD+ phosphorylase [Armatimonadota bacterium]
MRLGGRWNPPHSFPVLYTSCSREVAVANLWHRFEGEAIQPWEVAEERQADLYELRVSQAGLVDILTAEGIAGVGLPQRYPEGVGHELTQPVGRRLHGEGRPGVWCRSAALPTGQEIALFFEFAERPAIIGPPHRLWEWFPVPEDQRPG